MADPKVSKSSNSKLHEEIGIRQTQIILSLKEENLLLRSDLFAAHNVCNKQQKRIKHLLCKMDRSVVKCTKMEKEIASVKTELQDQIEINEGQEIQIEGLERSNKELNELVGIMETTLENWTKAKEREEKQRKESIKEMEQMVEYKDDQIKSMKKDLGRYKKENKVLKRKSSEDILDIAVIKARINRRQENRKSLEKKQKREESRRKSKQLPIVQMLKRTLSS